MCLFRKRPFSNMENGNLSPTKRQNLCLCVVFHPKNCHVFREVKRHIPFKAVFGCSTSPGSGAWKMMVFSTYFLFSVVWRWGWMNLANSELPVLQFSWIRFGQIRGSHVDFTLNWWFNKGNPLVSGKSRLVKYHNLARCPCCFNFGRGRYWSDFWSCGSTPTAQSSRSFVEFIQNHWFSSLFFNFSGTSRKSKLHYTCFKIFWHYSIVWVDPDQVFCVFCCHFSSMKVAPSEVLIYTRDGMRYCR